MVMVSKMNIEWKFIFSVFGIPIFSFELNIYLELIFFKFSSKFCSVCKRNLHLFIPTLALLANHGSKINTGLTSSATLHAAWSAGLSCSLSPFRNQWIAQVFILINWTFSNVNRRTKNLSYVKRREWSE